MQLIGLCRLGADAETKYTSNGDAVCSLNLAYNYGKKDEDGKRPTQWVRASLWGKRAESLAPYLLKGTQICVIISDLNTRMFEGKNGPAVSLEGRIMDLEFASKPAESASKSAEPSERQTRSASKPATVASVLFDDIDDDTPF